VQENLDDRVGIYVFPPIEGGFQGQPILGGGDLAALFNGNDDESKEVMRFLTSDEFGDKWAQAGGWLSPHTSFDMDNYPDQTTKDIATIAVEADVFRYDGSDLMPNAVGGGSFWSGMVQWMGGEKSSKQVTDDIEASWPSE
jgi:alpha-glucoside transport system substrate-binding protein